MRLRATLRIRNDDMIRARKAKGLNQRQAADAVGLSRNMYMRLEKLDYPQDGWLTEDDVIRIACFLEIPPESVVPNGAMGKRFDTTRTMALEFNPNLFEAAATSRSRLLLPSPAEQAEISDEAQMVLRCMDRTPLTSGQRRVVRLRFGLEDGVPRSSKEIAEEMHRSEPWIRELFESGLAKIRKNVMNHMAGKERERTHMSKIMDKLANGEIVQRVILKPDGDTE